MSKLSHLKEHIHVLEDINSIMKAMNNHALLEINKMTKFISTHEKSITTIREVGSDFFNFYPADLPISRNAKSIICILIGSERGLCGNFNEAVIQHFKDFEKSQANTSLKLVIVGRKLALRMADDDRVIQEMSGHETAEEISVVILNLLHALENTSLAIDVKPEPVSWRFFYNESDDHRINTHTLQPFAEFRSGGNGNYSFPPLLNLSVDDFLLEYIDNYLLAMLYYIFFRSFHAENYQRLHHLDNALERLDNNKKQLVQRLNMSRQEEITEEIEIIMLSVEVIANEMRDAV